MNAPKVEPSALKQVRWQEYAIRFALGGLITAAAGLVAKEYGPSFGGLFLGFPAIFPASITLVQKHEQEKARRNGEDAETKAKDLAGHAAAGTAIGAVGLVAFGLTVCLLASVLGIWATLILAVLAWISVSFIGWLVQELFFPADGQRSSRSKPAGSFERKGPALGPDSSTP